MKFARRREYWTYWALHERLRGIFGNRNSEKLKGQN